MYTIASHRTFLPPVIVSISHDKKPDKQRWLAFNMHLSQNGGCPVRDCSSIILLLELSN